MILCSITAMSKISTTEVSSWCHGHVKHFYITYYIYVSIIKRGRVRIPLTGLTPPHVPAYPKPGLVDIGGMFYNRYLNLLFIITQKDIFFLQQLISCIIWYINCLFHCNTLVHPWLDPFVINLDGTNKINN